MSRESDFESWDGRFHNVTVTSENAAALAAASYVMLCVTRDRSRYPRTLCLMASGSHSMRARGVFRGGGRVLIEVSSEWARGGAWALEGSRRRTPDLPCLGLGLAGEGSPCSARL